MCASDRYLIFCSLLLLGQIISSTSTKVIFDEDGDTFAPSAMKAMKEGHAPARLMSQFAVSIECATGRNPILDYGNYGCYCGIGGEGIPIDATDKCCQIHDDCYQKARDNGFCSTKLDVMLRWYSYRSDRCGTAAVDFSCKLPHQYGLFERLLSGADPTCAHTVCECDKAAALCFRWAEFNPQHRVYNKSMMCGNKVDKLLPGKGLPQIPGLDPGIGGVIRGPGGGVPGVKVPAKTPFNFSPGIPAALPMAGADPTLNRRSRGVIHGRGGRILGADGIMASLAPSK